MLNWKNSTGPIDRHGLKMNIQYAHSSFSLNCYPISATTDIWEVAKTWPWLLPFGACISGQHHKQGWQVWQKHQTLMSQPCFFFPAVHFTGKELNNHTQTETVHRCNYQLFTVEHYANVSTTVLHNSKHTQTDTPTSPNNNKKEHEEMRLAV